MNSKRPKLILLLAMLVLVAGAAVFLVTSLQRSSQDHSLGEQLYTCGMHPQVIQNKPGNCPICGMKLTPVRKQPGAKAPSMNANVGAPNDERKVKYYKSTMLLGEISQTPRKDSMGMEMAPVYEDESGDSSTISIDPVTVQNMGIRTCVVSKGPLRRNIRTMGVVDFDETTLADVTTKFKGWIEKLYVDATGKQVNTTFGSFSASKNPRVISLALRLRF